MCQGWGCEAPKFSLGLGIPDPRLGVQGLKASLSRCLAYVWLVSPDCQGIMSDGCDCNGCAHFEEMFDVCGSGALSRHVHTCICNTAHAWSHMRGIGVNEREDSAGFTVSGMAHVFAGADQALLSHRKNMGHAEAVIQPVLVIDPVSPFNTMSLSVTSTQSTLGQH